MPVVKKDQVDLDYIELQAISLREAYNRKMSKIFYTYETKLEFEGRLDRAVEKLISGAVEEITL